MKNWNEEPATVDHGVTLAVTLFVMVVVVPAVLWLLPPGW